MYQLLFFFLISVPSSLSFDGLVPHLRLEPTLNNAISGILLSRPILHVLASGTSILVLCLAIIGSFLIAYLIYKFRVKSLRDRQSWLEGQIKERTNTLNLINTKLEERQSELEEQQAELETYYHQVFQLAEIGQEITSSLELEEILIHVYNRVTGIMDAAEFAIGLYRQDENVIDYQLVIENGKIASYKANNLKINADDDSKVAVWVVKNKQAILINNVVEEIGQYISNPENHKPIAYKMPEALIYSPLMIKEKVLGVITVQSYRKNVYRKHHLDIIKTIAAYTAIALSNSQITTELMETNEELNHLLNRMREQNKLIELKNKNILDSLQYARRIQLAILPENKRILNAFKDCFIYYQPKDIISGDFYWFAEKKDHLLLAVIDCTGHGVPGAFMSVMANSALNEIVYDQNVMDTDDILTELNKKITQTLLSQNSDNPFNDGMDVCLIKYEPKNNMLEFSGAKRSLIYFRENSIQELKGNKFSIGNYQLDFDKKYDKTRIQIQNGDMVYLFTDGYPDQFGGQKGKKFLAGNFKKFLLEIHTQELRGQYAALINRIETWKGSYPQTDDILVIGVKF